MTIMIHTSRSTDGSPAPSKLGRGGTDPVHYTQKSEIYSSSCGVKCMKLFFVFWHAFDFRFRPSVPPSKQANKSLLMKAVNEAKTSIEKATKKAGKCNEKGKSLSVLF